MPVARDSPGGPAHSPCLRGEMAPRGVPDDIVQRLNREVERIMQSPEVQRRMTASAVAYVSMTPAQPGDFQRAETLRWGDVIRTNRLRVD